MRNGSTLRTSAMAVALAARAWRRRVLSWALVALVAACGGGGPSDTPLQSGVQLDNVVRLWRFFQLDEAGGEQLGSEHSKTELGVVDEQIDFGPLPYVPSDVSDAGIQHAYASVYSNEDGRTYWVSSVAPHAVANNAYALGNEAELTQYHFWRKTTADAKLQYAVTDILLEAKTANVIDPVECLLPSAQQPTWCLLLNKAAIGFWMVGVNRTRCCKPFMNVGGSAQLIGWQGKWELNVDAPFGSTAVLFDSDFEVNKDVNNDGGLHVRVKLARPFYIEVPLDDVRVGEEFYIRSNATATTYNGMQGESFYSAYFRDPVSSGGGVNVVQVGLEPVAPPAVLPELEPPEPLPACGLPDPEAGTLQFEAANFNSLEHSEGPAFVTRTGGTKGPVSVTFETSDGTAAGGADYRPLVATVTFADGQGGRRVVYVPIIGDSLAEGNETVNLRLSDARGCAALGAQSTAVLTIVDDDALPARFTVGGTVSGLAGGGLTLGSNGSSITVSASGPFTMPALLADGAAYDVRVVNQPANPAQVCSVTRGAGSIGGASVTNVAVECVTPQPNGALDPAFGSAGKVTSSSLTGGAKAMALQADGKIVLLSGTRSIVRYQADGALDTAFGSNGVATVGFSNGADTARALALQADGKIVVAGRAVGSTFDDFGITRLSADGTLDASFGAAGQVTVDLNGGSDEAQAVLVQDDGRIVVVGSANTTTPTGADSDFAAVRLLASGALDTSFGSNGRQRVGIAGRADIAAAAALRSDGGIVIAGRVAVDGGALPDTGVVVLGRNGDVLGTQRFDLQGRSEHDEAVDVVALPDGRILLAIALRSDGLWRYALARRQADGQPDPTFGGPAGSGQIVLSFAAGGDLARAMALLPDGRFVAAGITRPSPTQTSEIDDVLVTRHLADGTLDASFGSSGRVTVDFFGSSDGAECVSVLPDGRIVVAGLARNGSTNGLALLRLLP